MRDLKLLYKYATKTSKPNKSKGKKFGNVINWAMSLFFYSFTGLSNDNDVL